MVTNEPLGGGGGGVPVIVNNPGGGTSGSTGSSSSNYQMMPMMMYFMMKTLTPTNTLSSDWKYFHYSKKHYKLVTSSDRNWDDARNQCKLEGGDLASITSEYENDFIQSLNLPERAWVGGSSTGSVGSLTWSWSDGSTYGY